MKLRAGLAMTSWATQRGRQRENACNYIYKAVDGPDGERRMKRRTLAGRILLKLDLGCRAEVGVGWVRLCLGDG